MPEPYRSILIFGAPGVGKGTQGKLLGCIPGFFHLSTGDMFRNLEPDSEMGRTFHAYSSRGELVPDEFTVELWRHYMRTLVEKRRYRPDVDLLVLDGIPRSLVQVEAVREGIDVLGLIHLKARDENELLARMQRRARSEGRVDDADERVIRTRWEVYDRQTLPVLGAYDPSLVWEIDAIGTPCRVLSRILNIVAPMHERHFENALSVR
jgi:adenylate kinase